MSGSRISGAFNVASLQEIISGLTPDAWARLRCLSPEQNGWVHRYEWHHNKYYREDPLSDGFQLRQGRRGEIEIPYQRKLFYPSPQSRFALGDLPVAYFSCDFATNCCETIEQFSQEVDLSWSTISAYLQGNDNPTPGWKGYPISIHVKDEALILDASNLNNPFFPELAALVDGTPSLVMNIFSGRDPSDRLHTQSVSLAAYRNGFDGIVYTSVRAPADVVLPDVNLVMFREHLIIVD
jgi:hypothetical protein